MTTCQFPGTRKCSQASKGSFSKARSSPGSHLVPAPHTASPAASDIWAPPPSSPKRQIPSQPGLLLGAMHPTGSILPAPMPPRPTRFRMQPKSSRTASRSKRKPMPSSISRAGSPGQGSARCLSLSPRFESMARILHLRKRGLQPPVSASLPPRARLRLSLGVCLQTGLHARDGFSCAAARRAL